MMSLSMPGAGGSDPAFGAFDRPWSTQRFSGFESAATPTQSGVVCCPLVFGERGLALFSASADR